MGSSGKRRRLRYRFAEVGHNSIDRLIFLWVIPNGAWLVVPPILIGKFGAEILQKLDTREVKKL